MLAGMHSLLVHTGMDLREMPIGQFLRNSGIILQENHSIDLCILIYSYVFPNRDLQRTPSL